jgi:hypothetical protein
MFIDALSIYRITPTASVDDQLFHTSPPAKGIPLNVSRSAPFSWAL